MIDFLAGIPGKLKTLTDRLTSTRAGYLDNLSAGAVAQASTALSTAQWTNTRAGYLDSLPNIPTTPINSIQYFSIAMASVTSNTYTLSPSVNASKTVLILLGSKMSSGSSASDFQGGMTLTSGTTVTAYRQAASGTLTLYGVAVEFK